MIAVVFSTLGSCVKIEDNPDDAVGNFESLWQIMDENYCFFDEKERELGVLWCEVGKKYRKNVSNKMSQLQLFEHLGKMIGELKDGHVNLTAAFDVARNWSWKEDYPTNYSDTLIRRYLGTDYKIASGIKYRILDDEIGYMNVSSFDNEIGDGNLDEILLYFAPCRGLIIDVRNNGGGKVTEAQRLASRFCQEKTFVGYIRHKTGPGHDDFSAMKEQYIEPSSGIRWQKHFCVLTNRNTYSAANDFVRMIRQMPNVYVVGDKTGGGAGMPFSSELPNGWGVRFSSCAMYDIDKQSTENGIEPDLQMDILDRDFAKGEDSIIEEARIHINER